MRLSRFARLVKITKLKIFIYGNNKSKSRTIDAENTEALHFLKMICGYLKLDDIRKITIKRVV